MLQKKLGECFVNNKEGDIPMSMKSEDGTSRRGFLKIAGTAAPVAVVAIASGATVAEASPVDLSSGNMQDTAHTRAYLNSARF